MSLAKELGMCGKGEISSGRVKPLSKHLDTAVKCRTEEGLLGAHSSSGLWLVLLRWEHSAAAGQCCECWLCLMEVCCSLGAAVCVLCEHGVLGTSGHDVFACAGWEAFVSSHAVRKSPHELVMPLQMFFSSEWWHARKNERRYIKALDWEVCYQFTQRHFPLQKHSKVEPCTY